MSEKNLRDENEKYSKVQHAARCKKNQTYDISQIFVEIIGALKEIAIEYIHARNSS